jgi:hypothetical protein
MNNLTVITDFTRTAFARIYAQCQSLFSERLIANIEKYLNVTNSLLVPLSALIILVAGIVVSIKLSISTPFFGGVGAVFLVFFGDYISEKFHGACRAALEANPTSISSPAYLELAGFLNIFLGIGLVCGGVYFGIQSSSFLIFLGCITGAILVLLSNVPVINPHLINMSIADKSGIASDLIGLFSVNAKSGLYFSTLFSRLLTITGAVLIVVAIYKIMTAKGYVMFAALSDGGIAVAVLFAGLFYPVIAYFFFMIVFFIADILLAILSMKKS